MITKIDLQPIFIREKLIKLCRNFFDKQDFHEVIAPVLNIAIPLEQTLFPFTTEWINLKEKRKLFLTISPESSLKKMLAVGIGNCYSIGKSFRNLEAAGQIHNPEFLMLEWYRVNASMEMIMSDVQQLVESVYDVNFPTRKNDKRKSFTYQGTEISISSWQTLSFKNLFKEYLKVDLSTLLSMNEMIAFAGQKGYKTINATWEQLFDQLYLNEIEPHLPLQPYFLIDFPLQLSPLCAEKKDDPGFAERFEFFIYGIELGNGNTENTNADQILDSFKIVAESREALLISSPIDNDFIEALKALNGQQLAGIGVGIDRLAMIFADVAKIESVEPFSIHF